MVPDEIPVPDKRTVMSPGDTEPVFGAILDYQEGACPQGFILHGVHPGWSRWAPAILSWNERYARARPEPLTDGIIAYYLLEGIKILQLKNAVSQPKLDGWSSRIKRVIAVYDTQWKEGHNPQNASMGPTTGNDFRLHFHGQYYDVYDKNYPLNQQAIVLVADLLYQSMFADRTGAIQRAEKIIRDINEKYIVEVGGVDVGWYY